MQFFLISRNFEDFEPQINRDVCYFVHCSATGGVLGAVSGTGRHSQSGHRGGWTDRLRETWYEYS